MAVLFVEELSSTALNPKGALLLCLNKIDVTTDTTERDMNTWNTTSMKGSIIHRATR